MRKTILTAALVGTLGVGVGAVVSPGLASAATGGNTTVSHRLTALRNALTGLVSDRTLTQAQADKVATTLDQALPPGRPGGPGGPGRGAHLGPRQLATILGITPQELRTQLRAGKTLAQVAATKHINKADLIARLLTAAKAELTQAVSDGRLTPAQATAITSTLQARITAQVERPGFGRGGGHRGWGGPAAGPDGDADDATMTPRAGATPSPVSGGTAAQNA